jgi:hypothetical protein
LNDDDARALPESVFRQWQAGTAYTAGEVVVHQGVKYRVVQGHTSQAGWMPNGTAALYSSFATVDTGGGEQVEVWKRPTGGHDAYNIGDRVLFAVGDGFDGKIRESTIDGNVWPYTEYPAGWKAVN